MNERSLEFPVKGYLIRRLPKTSEIPKEFFENTYSSVQKYSDDSYSVSFSVRGLGGWEPEDFTYTVNGVDLLFKKFTGNLSELNNKQGLYMFINVHAKEKTYGYIGQSVNLEDRLNNHEQYKQGDFRYICTLHGNTSEKTRIAYEKKLVEDLCPQRNNHGTGNC